MSQTQWIHQGSLWQQCLEHGLHPPRSVLVFKHARTWKRMESGRRTRPRKSPTPERNDWKDSLCYWYEAVDNWGFGWKTPSDACEVAFRSLSNGTLRRPEHLTIVAQGVMMRALQHGCLVLGGAEAVRRGCAPPQGLKAQIGAVPVGLTGLGGRVAGGEVTNRTAFAHRVTHWGPLKERKINGQFHHFKRFNTV